MKLKYIFGMVAAVGLMNSCDVTDKKANRFFYRRIVLDQG